MTATTAPYKLHVSSTAHNHPPHQNLHIFMCELAMKIPTISFATDGIASFSGTVYCDEFLVYAGNEKVGRLWIRLDYVDGKAVEVYNISSNRITSGRRGSKSTKRSRHLKMIMREALKAFAPFEDKELAESILTEAREGCANVASRAGSQFDWAFRSTPLLIALAEYLIHVGTNGPAPIPYEVTSIIPQNWTEKLNNFKVANSVANEIKAGTGMAIRYYVSSGAMIAVDVATGEIVAKTESSYDLPVEYQDKLAVLKMMEKDQPIAGVGIKVGDSRKDHATFYLTPGAVPTTC